MSSSGRTTTGWLKSPEWISWPAGVLQCMLAMLQTRGRTQRTIETRELASLMLRGLCALTCTRFWFLQRSALPSCSERGCWRALCAWLNDRATGQQKVVLCNVFALWCCNVCYRLMVPLSCHFCTAIASAVLYAAGRMLQVYRRLTRSL